MRPSSGSSLATSTHNYQANIQLFPLLPSKHHAEPSISSQDASHTCWQTIHNFCSQTVQQPTHTAICQYLNTILKLTSSVKNITLKRVWTLCMEMCYINTLSEVVEVEVVISGAYQGWYMEPGTRIYAPSLLNCISAQNYKPVPIFFFRRDHVTEVNLISGTLNSES